MMRREVGIERYELKYGVGLSISSDSGDLDVAGLVDFLSAALSHLKNKREEMITDPFAMQPCCVQAFSRRLKSGECKILYDDLRLPLDHLINALVDAFVKANTLEQILDDHDAWAERAVREPAGCVSDIIRTCTEPGGKSRAWGLMLARASHVSPSRDLRRAHPADEVALFPTPKFLIAPRLFGRLTSVVDLREQALAQIGPFRLMGLDADGKYFLIGPSEARMRKDIPLPRQEFARNLYRFLRSLDSGPVGDIFIDESDNCELRSHSLKRAPK